MVSDTTPQGASSGPAPPGAPGEMLSRPARPRWRVLVSPRWICWHLFTVAAFAGMIWLGDWQLRRALSGNILSWAYTFEWPIFAVFGAVFWVKTVRDELAGVTTNDAFAADIEVPAGARRSATLLAGAPSSGAPSSGGSPDPDGPDPDGPDSDGPEPHEDTEPDDAELAEYNAYLARLGKEVKGHGRWHGLR
jgi:hypothetical protein